MKELNIALKNMVISLDYATAIDCKWSQWGEWTQCHQTCSPGEKSKMRTHAILAQFGGEECEGDAQVSTQCNTVDDLKQTIAEQAAEIAHLKGQQHHHG